MKPGLLICSCALAASALGAHGAGTNRVRPRPPGVVPPHITVELAPLQTAKWLENVPEHLVPALRNPHRRPTGPECMAVQAADKPWLLATYRKQKAPHDRVALAWVLAYAGGDDVFKPLYATLVGRPGQEYDFECECRAMGELLFSAGLLAQTSDKAYDWLKEATAEAWWAQHRKWREKTSKGVPVFYSSSWMAGLSVKALGFCGRQDALGVLEDVRRTGPCDDLGRLKHASEIFLARRELGICRKMGLEAYREKLWTEEHRKERLAWCKTDEGMAMVRWAFPPDDPRYKDVWRDLDAWLKKTVTW